MKTIYNIETIETDDPSIACIYAIRQIMNIYGLSADGKDKRAVYSWFMERYKPGVLITENMGK